MVFCDICDSVMTKLTTAQGTLIFKCVCQNTRDGTAEDTLMASEHVEKVERAQLHTVFVTNSPHDTAGNKVLRDCKVCGLNFMTLISIGDNETTLYTCTCSNVET